MDALYAILLPILFAIESVNGTQLVGDNGDSIGPYHIQKIYVRDANRIVGEDRYTYEDRNDKVKSEEMIMIVCTHYNKSVLKMGISMEEMLVRVGCTHNLGGAVNSKRHTKDYKEYGDKIRAIYNKK